MGWAAIIHEKKMGRKDTLFFKITKCQIKLADRKERNHTQITSEQFQEIVDKFNEESVDDYWRISMYSYDDNYKVMGEVDNIMKLPKILSYGDILHHYTEEFHVQAFPPHRRCWLIPPDNNYVKEHCNFVYLSKKGDLSPYMELICVVQYLQ